jgi:hypothetical protein
VEALVPEPQGRVVLVGEIMALVYFIGCFLALFPIARVFATDFGDSTPDTESTFLGILIGFCLCWFWPLGVFAVPVYYAVKHWE